MILRPLLICLVIAVVAFFPVACKSQKTDSGQEQETAPVSRQYRVTDRFQTSSVVRALKIDGPYLWVGTSTGVVQTEWATGEMVKTYTTESTGDGLKSNYVFTIQVGPDGTRWFGTDAGGLSALRGGEWKSYMPEDGLADEWVYDIDFTEDGSVWVGTWDGVSRFDGKGFITYGVEDGLANKWVYGVAVDRDGTLWFGTEEGVSHFEPGAGTWKTYTQNDGLGAPNKLALPEKPTAGELFEAAKESVELAPGRSYEGHFHDLSPFDEEGNDTYNENYIFSILIDRNGDKWFGTWGGGVSRYDGKEWKNYTTEEGLAGNIVYAVEEDSLGQIWVGTHKGVSVFDGTRWKSYGMSDGLVGSDVFSVMPAPNQKIWLGQGGGVVQLGESQG
jgi:ligand-binding sensor domain-containing protein